MYWQNHPQQRHVYSLLSRLCFILQIFDPGSPQSSCKREQPSSCVGRCYRYGMHGVFKAHAQFVVSASKLAYVKCAHTTLVILVYGRVFAVVTTVIVMWLDA
jgi:hypothetical protein